MILLTLCSAALAQCDADDILVDGTYNGWSCHIDNLDEAPCEPQLDPMDYDILECAEGSELGFRYTSITSDIGESVCNFDTDGALVGALFHRYNQYFCCGGTQSAWTSYGAGDGVCIAATTHVPAESFDGGGGCAGSGAISLVLLGLCGLRPWRRRAP